MWYLCAHTYKYRRGVIIYEVRVPTFGYPTIQKIFNTFGALTWIPEFCQYPRTLNIVSTFGDHIGTHSHPQISVLMSMHQMYWKFSKFSGTDKIRVFTSMHQMYSKLSATGVAWVSMFHGITTRNLSIPEWWILWHLWNIATWNVIYSFGSVQETCSQWLHYE